MSAALREALDDARKGLAEWRALALSLQAQVKHQAGQRKSELVTLEHASAVVRSVQPNLSTTARAWAQLVEECSYWLQAERNLGCAVQQPMPNNLPDDYEVN